MKITINFHLHIMFLLVSLILHLDTRIVLGFFILSLSSGLAHSHCLLSLLAQLLPSQRQLLLSEVRELEPLHNGPLAVLDSGLNISLNVQKKNRLRRNFM